MTKKTIMGAICGDIIGSGGEGLPVVQYDFDLFKKSRGFTDDTVQTVAVAFWLMNSDDGSQEDLEESLKFWSRANPNVGYGPMMGSWLSNEYAQDYGGIYRSFGNGSAMRVSPCGLFDDYKLCIRYAAESAIPTHSHPVGIKGAICVADLMHKVRHEQCTKYELAEYIQDVYNYKVLHNGNLITPQEIRDSGYEFDCTCEGSIPQALTAFLCGNSYEEVIRNACWLGGDADTQAAIAGSIAACIYEIPEEIINGCKEYLTPELLQVVEDFDKYIAQQ